MRTKIFILLIFSSFGLKSQDRKFGIALMISNPIYDYKVGYFDIDMESVDNGSLTWKSYNIGGQAYYNLNKQTTYRLRFGYTKTDVKEYTDQFTNGYRTITTAHAVQNKFQIAPSIIWNFRHEKLNIYVGFELPYSSHGAFDFKVDGTITDSTSGAIVYNGTSFAKIPKGFSAGVGAIFGFNYNLTKSFSIGAEFSPSLLYAKTGGKVETSDYFSPFQTANNKNVSTDYNKGFTYYENRFSICLTYWFIKNKK